METRTPYIPSTIHLSPEGRRNKGFPGLGCITIFYVEALKTLDSLKLVSAVLRYERLTTISISQKCRVTDSNKNRFSWKRSGKEDKIGLHSSGNRNPRLHSSWISSPGIHISVNRSFETQSPWSS